MAAVSVTLHAIAAKRRTAVSRAAEAGAGRSAANRRKLLQRLIDGTDRQTDGRTDTDTGTMRLAAQRSG